MKSTTDISKLDDNQIQEGFEEAFRASGDDRDNDLRLAEVDVLVERTTDRSVLVKAIIYGLAEVTTQEQFFDQETGKVIKGGQQISFDVDGRGQAVFTFVGVDRKNSNDYVVIYKAS